jgi:hypothetical protein
MRRGPMVGVEISPPLTARKERDSSMVQIFLVGLGAGAAAALLFASIATGSVLSLALFYVSPLPILIVALGWSHWAGLVAALVAFAGLTALFGNNFAIAFLLSIGLPAWWLSYLALLARPVATPTGSVLEWYPVGRIVLWTAGLSALVVVAGLSLLGSTEETIRGELRRSFEAVLRRQGPIELGERSTAEALAAAAPPAAAISITLINLISLWLAGRIVKVSNRLRRPWPDLSQMEFPPAAAVILGLLLAGILLAGLIGLVSAIFLASLCTAYVVLGFAVLHTITRGMNTRGLVLSAAYVAALLIWPVLLLIALLGVADTVMGIRRRIWRTPGPPNRPT